MSLYLPRPLASLFMLAVAAAVVTASCGGSEPRSTVAPSALSTSAAVSGGATRVTTAGGAPETADGADHEPGHPPAPAPGPEPAPAPGPEPAPEPGPPASGPAPAPLPAPAPNPALDPGPFPAPLPGPGIPRRPILWHPSTHPRVLLRVNPDPVPFSGVPVPLAGCRELAHTWYYEQVIHAQTGIPFRLTERENYFDGYYVSRTNENIYVEGNGTARINSRWCSAFGMAHTAQHRFKGKDDEGNDIIINGPLIRLQQNPSYVPPPPTPAPRSETTRMRSNPLLVWGD
jgi:hypothetical protein